jgi:hypothetical protein
LGELLKGKAFAEIPCTTGGSLCQTHAAKKTRRFSETTEIDRPILTSAAGDRNRPAPGYFSFCLEMTFLTWWENLHFLPNRQGIICIKLRGFVIR